ncbi:MAG: terpene cyclase/mutase family protein [Planctomycetaceae bacterium]
MTGMVLLATMAPSDILGQAARSKESLATINKKLVTAETTQTIQRGLAELASRQREDGSFGSGRYRGSVAVTALSGMAFLAGGHTPGRGKYGAVVTNAVKFLLSRTQPGGFIVDDTDQPHRPMYGHGFATTFLAEVYGMTGRRDLKKSLREKLKKAVNLIISSQRTFQVNVNGVDVRGGGWRYHPSDKDADLSVTVCQVMALRAARNCGIAVPKKVITLSVAYVKACQNRDGGFRYQTIMQSDSIFPRSAAGVVALYSAGIYQGREIDRALKYLMRYLPRKNLALRSGHYFYGHYYAVQAMYQAGGNHWKDWYPAIRDELLASQRNNGSWRDPEVCDEYGTAMACLVLQTPLNYLPIFQR